MAPIALNNELEVATFKKTPDLGSAVEETGESVRLAARSGTYTKQTSGAAPTYLQANLIILPSKYAADFRILCRRNPVPCPLLAESKGIGKWNELQSWIDGLEGEQIAKNVDLRHDFPKYMVYQDGVLTKSHCLNVEDEWTEDHVGFLIGCSYSFESALTEAGLIPTHTANRRNVPMYVTNIPLCPAGVFQQSTYVVSMRPYRSKDIEKVRDITRPFVATHGEPIAWGWDAVSRLGIRNINQPDFGEAPVAADGSPLEVGGSGGDEEVVPVFWGCGVTPQEAVRRAGIEGTVIGHAPGYMLVLDIRDWDIIPKV
ncbi:hypothetical protein LTR99_002409 [Exophiala xenobiotica]|uniref:Hydro-lyase n=1 Tax=Vermiconidia calcicola TaxID=1690605 RepID=A0AAV9QI52_9PEZI|nr:hypothetical protein LTR99_002409 [Exophiala xenobiotica]KAK5434022.1 hypothetical protein LTR34_003534 [Exophiala xenobiotica]KAK5541518.1 hypothetical protein LTR23_005840 [Chaetothyriales sp. CCFEE 6169]KAK5542254.1 hypothetical protein LTR25_002139 [Vermiconidia calcicola]